MIYRIGPVPPAKPEATRKSVPKVKYTCLSAYSEPRNGRQNERLLSGSKRHGTGQYH